MGNYWHASEENQCLWLTLLVDDKEMLGGRSMLQTPNYGIEYSSHWCMAWLPDSVYIGLDTLWIAWKHMQCLCVTSLTWSVWHGAPCTHWHDIIRDNALRLRQDQHQLEHVASSWGQWGFLLVSISSIPSHKSKLWWWWEPCHMCI